MIGETKEVTIILDTDAFKFYDVTKHDWKVKRDDFKIIIGASSVDERLEKTITNK